MNLAEYAVAKVPVSMWEQISPIFLEPQLRLPDAPVFLGSGVLYEDIIRLNNLDPNSQKVMASVPRNSEWEHESQLWLKDKVCVICGGKFRLVAHHKKPFHLFPDLEMVPSNWISVCEGRPSCNCHLTFGHFGNWTLWNPDVDQMSSDYGTGFQKARHPETLKNNFGLLQANQRVI